MRSFVQDYIFENAIWVVLDYFFVCLLIYWKAQFNTRVKSADIRDEVMVFGWGSSPFWSSYGTPFIFMGVSIALFGADFGWLLDIFCWLGFFLGAFIWIAFFFTDKTYIMKNEYVIVPAFGKRKDHFYNAVQGVVVNRSQVDYTDETTKSKKTFKKDQYKISITSMNESHQVEGDIKEMQELLRFLKDKIPHEKFEFVDQTVESKEEAEQESNS